MTVVATPGDSDQARPRGSRRRLVLLVAGYVVWLLVVCGLAFVLSFAAHFDCGGTFGGFGENATARRDEGCYQLRTRVFGFGLLALTVAPVAFHLFWQRRRRARST